MCGEGMGELGLGLPAAQPLAPPLPPQCAMKLPHGRSRPSCLSAPSKSGGGGQRAALVACSACSPALLPPSAPHAAGVRTRTAACSIPRPTLPLSTPPPPAGQLFEVWVPLGGRALRPPPQHVPCLHAALGPLGRGRAPPHCPLPHARALHSTWHQPYCRGPPQAELAAEGAAGGWRCAWFGRAARNSPTRMQRHATAHDPGPLSTLAEAAAQGGASLAILTSCHSPACLATRPPAQGGAESP